MGVPIPSIGDYVVKPITNVAGMGVGSSVHTNVTNTIPYQAGYFWVELLTGDHISVDYQYGVPCLVLKGEHHPHETTKFSLWSRLATIDAPILPPSIQSVCEQYPQFNAEFIGGTVIEVHCRVGGDSWIFDDPTVAGIIPVWEDGIVNSDDEFVPSLETACETRLGFKICRTNTVFE